MLMTFIGYLRTAWSTMLELPWRPSKKVDPIARTVQRVLLLYFGTDGLKIYHPELLTGGMRWVVWIVAWVWFLAALFLGAVVAPVFIRFTGLTSYQYDAAVVIALLVGVIVHTLGWFSMFLADWSARGIKGPVSNRRYMGFALIGLLLVFWPIATVGGVLYSYLTWIGPGQRLITIAFVWSLLITTVGTAIKGVVLPYLGKRLVDWVRGGKSA